MFKECIEAVMNQSAMARDIQTGHQSSPPRIRQEVQNKTLVQPKVWRIWKS